MTSDAASIGDLQRELAELRGKVAFYEGNPMASTSCKTEAVVATAAGLSLAKKFAGNDLYCPKSGLTIEVKYSRAALNRADIGYKRWAWANLFGRTRSKRYERLILLGEKDTRYLDLYKNKQGEFVIFDLPYDDVLRISKGAGTAGSQIRLSTNPKTKNAFVSDFYRAYEVCEDDLKRRYSALP